MSLALTEFDAAIRLPRASYTRQMRVVVALASLALFLNGADAPFEKARVHYESYGSGSEAIVFIHGWTCDLTFWRGQAPVYQKYRSLLIDLPGHGQSDKSAVNYTMERFARGVEAVLRDAHVEHAILVGHSMGGPVALEFLRLFPQKAKAVVFVDGYLRFEPAGPDRSAQKIRAANYKPWMSGLIDGMFSPNTTPEMRAEIKSKMLAAPHQMLVSAWEGMRNVAPIAPQEKYSIPALAILTGGPTRAAYEKRLRKVFPGLRGYETWEGSGHFLMMESPERFNASLAAFVDGLGGSKP